jgi:branched-chain amino acid transport system substrate-binding protein
LIDIAKDNSNGIVFVDGFFKDSEDKDVKDFVNGYNDTFEAEPTILEAESYDSAKMIISLIRDNDLQDREELKEALDDLENYKGVTGVVRTFQDGDADEDLVLLTVIREKIKQLTIVETDEVLPE